MPNNNSAFVCLANAMPKEAPRRATVSDILDIIL